MISHAPHSPFYSRHVHAKRVLASLEIKFFASAFLHYIFNLKTSFHTLDRTTQKKLRLTKLVESHSSQRLVISQQSQLRYLK